MTEELKNREGALGVYVSQLQDEFDRRESQWWGKQLGKDTEAPAA